MPIITPPNAASTAPLRRRSCVMLIPFLKRMPADYSISSRAGILLAGFQDCSGPVASRMRSRIRDRLQEEQPGDLGVASASIPAWARLLDGTNCGVGARYQDTFLG